MKDVSCPHLETKLLLMESLSIQEAQFHAHPQKKVFRKQEREFYRLIFKRSCGFPLAYLRGKKEFWSLEYQVGPGVFIPRPETELLVEKVIELWSEGKEIIVDIGTGTGNIALSLDLEIPNARILATDVDSTALNTARKNSLLNQGKNIQFIQGSLFVPLEKKEWVESCDFIVSNPPYVCEKEWGNLQPEIKNHEPKKAVVAGKRGLEFIEKLIQGAPRYLKPGGYLCLEIGSLQKSSALALFGREWKSVQVHNDMQNLPRVVTAQKS